VGHWRNDKGTLEKGFDDVIFEKRPSSINLRRLESPWGKSLKGRWIMRWWSHHMSFKKSPSRVEGECPSSGVVEQATSKGFKMEACQIVIRHERGFKILPGKYAKMLSHKL
jgi:hypothetical protein